MKTVELKSIEDSLAWLVIGLVLAAAVIIPLAAMYKRNNRDDDKH